MANVTVTTKVQITNPLGDVEPITAALYTQSYTARLDQTYSLSDTVAVTAWDPTAATAAATNFDFLYIETDATAGVHAEFVTNKGSTAAATDTKLVMKNLPFLLGSDDSFSASGFAGSLDVIDKISFVNPTNGTTVSVRLILLT
jgi:hypothetical protein